MNLIQRTRAALAAVVLAGGVLGATVAPSFADAATTQPTQIVFTSRSAFQDPAKGFDAASTAIVYWGFVSSNASGTVVLLDADPNGNITYLASAPVTDGQWLLQFRGFPPTEMRTHMLTAMYLGNDMLAPSTSPVFTQVIQGQHS